MKTMKILSALMAATLFAFSALSPVYAQDPDDGTTVDEPMDPGTEDPGTDDSGDAETE